MPLGRFCSFAIQDHFIVIQAGIPHLVELAHLVSQFWPLTFERPYLQNGARYRKMLLNIKVSKHCKTHFLLEIFRIKVYLKAYFAKRNI